MQSANGATTRAAQRSPNVPESYEAWARQALLGVFSPSEGDPPNSLIRPVVGVLAGVVYALLEIARAIREVQSS